MSCPWCDRVGIRVKAMKRSIRKICLKDCGYNASIPKDLLSFEEKKKYYGNLEGKKKKRSH